MERKIQKVLSREEKQKIMNFTLDSMSMGCLKGVLAAFILNKFFKRGAIPILGFSYFVGMSLRESNEYIFENYRN
jgi:hypothetical protein